MKIAKKVASNIYNELLKPFEDLVNIEIDQKIKYDNEIFDTHIELFAYELDKHYNYYEYNDWFDKMGKSINYYTKLHKKKQ
tara:strand:- start:322 stop:564 length:243 start_codon:yes stop_codon:yes gene_type:complete